MDLLIDLRKTVCGVCALDLLLIKDRGPHVPPFPCKCAVLDVRLPQSCLLVAYQSSWDKYSEN